MLIYTLNNMTSNENGRLDLVQIHMAVQLKSQGENRKSTRFESLFGISLASRYKVTSRVPSIDETISRDMLAERLERITGTHPSYNIMRRLDHQAQRHCIQAVDGLHTFPAHPQTISTGVPRLSMTWFTSQSIVSPYRVAISVLHGENLPLQYLKDCCRAMVCLGKVHPFDTKEINQEVMNSWTLTDCRRQATTLMYDLWLIHSEHSPRNPGGFWYRALKSDLEVSTAWGRSQMAKLRKRTKDAEALSMGIEDLESQTNQVLTSGRSVRLGMCSSQELRNEVSKVLGMLDEQLKRFERLGFILSDAIYASLARRLSLIVGFLRPHGPGMAGAALGITAELSFYFQAGFGLIKMGTLALGVTAPWVCCPLPVAVGIAGVSGYYILKTGHRWSIAVIKELAWHLRTSAARIIQYLNRTSSDRITASAPMEMESLNTVARSGVRVV